MPQPRIFETEIQATTTKMIVGKSKIIRAVLPVVLLLGAVGTLQSRAQEQSATPQNQHAGSAPKQRGPAQELVHETREAAGQEDETAEFKQSPSVKMIARLAGLSLASGGARCSGWQVGYLIGFLFVGLPTSLRLTVVCNSHPMIALQLKHQRFWHVRRGCRGGWLSGLHDDLGWRRLDYPGLVIRILVIRIEVRYICRTGEKPSRAAQSN